MGDEAIYSQIAKESIARNSFLTFYWKGQLWFEKPPLMLWLTIASFKLFGISETSAHIFPGIFGILSSLVLYAIGKELFKNKLAGFLAGFVFLTTPIVLLYNRAAMMDIPAGFFISLCALAILKIKSKNKDSWWLVYFIALGLGVLTKSVVGLLPLGFFLFYLLTAKNLTFLRKKHFYLALCLFLLITLPWHLLMTAKFGVTFWNDYFGFHVWQRLNTQIFQHHWLDATNLGYLKLLFSRSGIWFWLFILFSLSIATNFLIQQSYGLKSKISSQFMPFLSWTRNNLSNLIFLIFWMLICLAPFFYAPTKLPNYMLLFFFPLSIFVGGFLAFLAEKRLAMLLLSLFSLLNFLPIARLHASDFGEAHFLFPKLLIRFFNFNNKALLIFAFFLAILFILFYIKSKSNLGLQFKKFAFILFIGLNILIPFNPLRNEFLKKLGQDISTLSNNQPVTFYYKMQPDQYSFDWVEAFYLPLDSKITNIGNQELTELSRDQKNNKPFCFIEKNFTEAINSSKIISSYNEGFLVNCAVENDGSSARQGLK